MAYVWTWYRALKAASASLVTSILTLGAVITVGLAMLFEGKGLTEAQVLALAVMILGAMIFVVRLPWRLAQPAEAT
jgi:drug/metabolite transporter (DMT)-like permease